MNLKQNFIEEYKKKKDNLKYIIVAVLLPTGGIEIITNTEFLGYKYEYYVEAYNENFELKNNNKIKIINYMLV